MLASAETNLLQNKSEVSLVDYSSEQTNASEQPVTMQLRSPNAENEELSKYSMLDSFRSCILYCAHGFLKFKFILIRRQRRCELAAQIIKHRASRN